MSGTLGQDIALSKIDDEKRPIASDNQRGEIHHRCELRPPSGALAGYVGTHAKYLPSSQGMRGVDEE